MRKRTNRVNIIIPEQIGAPGRENRSLFNQEMQQRNRKHRTIKRDRVVVLVTVLGSTVPQRNLSEDCNGSRWLRRYSRFLRATCRARLLHRSISNARSILHMNGSHLFL